MTDDPETTDEVVDPPVDEVDEEQPDAQDEEDVGALKRAYERVKEKHRSESAIWDDEEAFLARVQEKFPHLMADTPGDDVLDDDDDIDDDDEPVADPRVDFVYQREVQRQIDQDLASFVGDRDLAPKAREWVIARAQQDLQGFNPKALEKAVTEWFELTAEPAPKAKRKPSHQPLKSGGPATEVPDLSDRDKRRAYMFEKAQQLASQQ